MESNQGNEVVEVVGVQDDVEEVEEVDMDAEGNNVSCIAIPRK